MTLDADDPGAFTRAVHESRTRVKKVRAVAAFLNAAGGRVPRKDRSRLKSAARTLSRVRDSAAIVEALDRLHHSLSGDMRSRSAAASIVEHRKSSPGGYAHRRRTRDRGVGNRSRR